MKEDPKRGVTQGFGNAHIFLGCIIYIWAYFALTIFEI